MVVPNFDHAIFHSIPAAPRFRGIRALFARVSTRVRAALRSVATADAPAAGAAGAAGKQPATAAAATAAEHAHHTSQLHILSPSLLPRP